MDTVVGTEVVANVAVDQSRSLRCRQMHNQTAGQWPLESSCIPK